MTRFLIRSGCSIRFLHSHENATMAFCRFVDQDGSVQVAIFRDDQILPLRAISESLSGDINLFSCDLDTLKIPEQSGDWQPTPERLLPPVSESEKVICIGLNYRDHAIETKAEIPTEPVVFSKFNSTLIGHGETIQLPKVSEQVDYESELVVVIGKKAKHVARDEAMDYVFGYTCGHDVSARDWQKGRPGGQWLLGKTFDTFAPVGPCVVTKKELTDSSNVRVQMHLNGSVVQDSTTTQLIFSIPELIEHLSQIVTLRPGDLIFTGTPPGVGMARNPPVFLADGDLCEVKIDGIGTLRNQCTREV